MKSTARSSSEGAWCGRAGHGVSNLSNDDMHQIAAHRAKDRPTPWPHLAVRFGVNEIDLRRLFEVNDNVPVIAATPRPAPPRPERTARDAVFTQLWEDGHAKSNIAAAMRVKLSTVDRMRDRLGLTPRTRATKPNDWSPAESFYVRQNYILGGVSASTVGKHLGRSRHAVIGFAHRQGWSRYTLGGRE